MDVKILTRDLLPLRELLQSNMLGMLCHLWDKDRFAGLPRTNWPQGITNFLEPAEALIFELLFAGNSVETRDAEQILGMPCLCALEEHNILCRNGAGIRSNGLLLSSHFGHYIFSGYSGDVSSRSAYVHLGYDSFALGELLMYAPLSERTLDLCSGSAILSLVLASRKTAVTAVEWSEYVAAISQVNVALSPYAGHIEIRTGDLFGPVAGSRFDLIVANPPFSPTPIIPGTERAAAGGSDGLQITRRILESANDFLTGNGTLLMLTGMVGTAQNAFFESELQAYANQFHCRIDMIDVREPQPIEKLTIPRYHEEPLVRLQQIHDAASVLRASHYHVGIIRMARNGGPRFSRIGPESRTAGWARAARAYRQLRKKAPM